MVKRILDNLYRLAGYDNWLIGPTKEEKLLELQLRATIRLLLTIGEIIIFRTNNNIRCEIGRKPFWHEICGKVNGSVRCRCFRRYTTRCPYNIGHVKYNLRVMNCET